MEILAGIKKTGFGLTLAILVLLTAVPADSASPLLQINPPEIRIGTFFDGAVLTVSADIPAGCQAVFEINGKCREEDLMRKGRRWDIWMNTAQIDITGVPFVYLAMSSAPGLLRAGREDHPWGYGALRRTASFAGPVKKSDFPILFREFIRLKEGRRLYGTFPGKVDISCTGKKTCLARGTFDFPIRIPPGTYDVCLYAIRNGKIIRHQCDILKVEMGGMPAFIRFLSSSHAAGYGLLAAAIAVAVGLMSGILFRSKKEPDSCETDSDMA